MILVGYIPEFPESQVEWLALLFRIREIPKLFLETGYPDWWATSIFGDELL
jgi:hypothetical protein